MSVCLVHVNVAAYYSMKSNKYEVRVDATDEAEANFQASQINQNSLVPEVNQFLTPFLEGSVKLTYL